MVISEVPTSTGHGHGNAPIHHPGFFTIVPSNLTTYYGSHVAAASATAYVSDTPKTSTHTNHTYADSVTTPKQCRYRLP